MKHVLTDPLRDPSPPLGVSTHNFRLDRSKSLPFPPIVLKRWDLPRGRKQGKIPDARFGRPVFCDRVTRSTIVRRRWRWGGPNPLGRQMASRMVPRNMSSPIPYGTHPLHQAFPPITFASTVEKAYLFRRSSLNDGIFHAAENREKSQTSDFDGLFLAIG